MYEWYCYIIIAVFIKYKLGINIFLYIYNIHLTQDKAYICGGILYMFYGIKILNTAPQWHNNIKQYIPNISFKKAEYNGLKYFLM